MRNLCGSELLVTILNKEVRKFERNASVLSQPDDSLLSDLFAMIMILRDFPLICC